MRFYTSIKCFSILVACLVLLVGCGPTKPVDYGASPSYETYPTDSDNDYVPPVPSDNDGDWYYNYYDLEY